MGPEVDHESLAHQISDTRDEILKHIDVRFEEHEAVMHRSLVERIEIEAADGRIESKVDAVATELEQLAGVILGPRRDAFMGGGRSASLGLVARLDGLEAKMDQLIEGQGVVKLSVADRVSIYVAVIGALGFIVASALGLIG